MPNVSLHRTRPLLPLINLLLEFDLPLLGHVVSHNFDHLSGCMCFSPCDELNHFGVWSQIVMPQSTGEHGTADPAKGLSQLRRVMDWGWLKMPMPFIQDHAAARWPL